MNLKELETGDKQSYDQLLELISNSVYDILRKYKIDQASITLEMKKPIEVKVNK